MHITNLTLLKVEMILPTGSKSKKKRYDIHDTIDIFVIGDIWYHTLKVLNK